MVNFEVCMPVQRSYVRDRSLTSSGESSIPPDFISRTRPKLKLCGLSNIQLRMAEVPIGKYLVQCYALSGKLPVAGIWSEVTPSGNGKECQPQWDMVLPPKVWRPVASTLNRTLHFREESALYIIPRNIVPWNQRMSVNWLRWSNCNALCEGAH